MLGKWSKAAGMAEQQSNLGYVKTGKQSLKR